MLEHNHPVELSAPDFELVLCRSSKVIARVGEDFLFDGGGMHEIQTWDLTLVDECTVGHGEKGGGVEAVAIDRGILG